MPELTAIGVELLRSLRRNRLYAAARRANNVRRHVPYVPERRASTVVRQSLVSHEIESLAAIGSAILP